LQYLVLDDVAAESIQQVAALAKQNMNEYLTVSTEVALTAVELMKFYMDTKKLLYGFPLITIPPTQEVNVGPSVSQQINVAEQTFVIQRPSDYRTTVRNTSRSVVSHYSGFSVASSSVDPFNGSTIDATIKKILLYKEQTITATRLAQILRVSSRCIYSESDIFHRHTIACSDSWCQCRKCEENVRLFGQLSDGNSVNSTKKYAW